MHEIGGLGNAIESQGLRELRGRVQNPSEEDLAEVAKQFEAIFVEMMLKQMRSATPGEEMFSSNGEDTYRSLFDRQMAVQMASNEGMGLAPMIEGQLRRNAGFETNQIQGGPRELDDYRRSAQSMAAWPAAAHDSDGAQGAGHDLRGFESGNGKSKAAAIGGGEIQEGAETAGASAPSALGTKGPAWSSPHEFVEQISPVAKSTAERLGVSPVALVAQAALETGWGRHVIQDGDGGSSNNLFNIKAQYSGWNGDSVTVPTLEYRNGVEQREMADFRSYASIEESFADYADFLERNPRYQEALKVGDDPGRFVRALQEAGYATDPNYADKLERIMAIDPEGGAAAVRAGNEVLKISDNLPNS